MEYRFKKDQKIHWMSFISPASVFLVEHGNDQDKVKSVQASGYAAAKKAGLKMATEIKNDFIECRFVVDERDRRLSNYDFLRNMKPGQGHVLPWDLSAGAPAPEYRPIKRVYDQLVKQGWKMQWQATPKDVIITRLA